MSMEGTVEITIDPKENNDGTYNYHGMYCGAKVLSGSCHYFYIDDSTLYVESGDGSARYDRPFFAIYLEGESSEVQGIYDSIEGEK